MCGVEEGGDEDLLQIITDIATWGKIDGAELNGNQLPLSFFPSSISASRRDEGRTFFDQCRGRSNPERKAFALQ